jgi:hypothetical protein
VNREELTALAGNPVLMEVGRRAVEDELTEWRDSRRFTLRNNGLVIKEKDGNESSVIRFGPEAALRIALEAIASVSEEELAALQALYDAGPGHPELVKAYEAEHAKGQEHD